MISLSDRDRRIELVPNRYMGALDRKAYRGKVLPWAEIVDKPQAVTTHDLLVKILDGFFDRFQYYQGHMTEEENAEAMLKDLNEIEDIVRKLKTYHTKKVRKKIAESALIRAAAVFMAADVTQIRFVHPTLPAITQGF